MVRARDLGADGGRPVVREVADGVRTAGDREPGFRAQRLGCRVELIAHAVHSARLDPLERRPTAGERDEIELGVEDVVEAVAAAPVLQRVEVEAEDVGARGEGGIHPAALRQRLGAAVEVVRQRQEARAGAGRGAERGIAPPSA